MRAVNSPKRPSPGAHGQSRIFWLKNFKQRDSHGDSWKANTEIARMCVCVCVCLCVYVCVGMYVCVCVGGVFATWALLGMIIV
jgi:hypothetical protein